MEELQNLPSLKLTWHSFWGSFLAGAMLVSASVVADS